MLSTLILYSYPSIISLPSEHFSPSLHVHPSPFQSGSLSLFLPHTPPSTVRNQLAIPHLPCSICIPHPHKYNESPIRIQRYRAREGERERHHRRRGRYRGGERHFYTGFALLSSRARRCRALARAPPPPTFEVTHTYTRTYPEIGRARGAASPRNQHKTPHSWAPLCTKPLPLLPPTHSIYIYIYISFAHYYTRTLL